MEAVIIAFFTMVTGFFSWKASRHSKGAYAEAQRARSDIKTNHGRRPGEYLEMIAEIMAEQRLVRQELGEHTAQDSRNFQGLSDRIALIAHPEEK